MPVRVATLTRRSLDQAHQPFSIEAQDTKLKAYIQSQDDWQLVRTYSDDMSGATLDRPGLQASLRDARAGRFDVLLVYRVDRIARSLRGLLEILDELDRAGVAFRSVSEHFDTATPVGRMLIRSSGRSPSSSGPPSSTGSSPGWNARPPAAPGAAATGPSATRSTRPPTTSCRTRRRRRWSRSSSTCM